MRKRLAALAIGTALVAAPSQMAQAQPAATPISLVLATCPAPTGQACIPAVAEMVASLPPGATRDPQLAELAAALATIAQEPTTPLLMCLDAADGIRAAGNAMSDAELQTAAYALADSLCQAGFETAAIPASTETPRSLASQGGTTPEPKPQPETPPPVIVVPVPQPPVVETPPVETPPQTPPVEDLPPQTPPAETPPETPPPEETPPAPPSDETPSGETPSQEQTFL